MRLIRIYSPQVSILKDLRILLVDNDIDSRYLYTILLRELGANVMSSGSIEQALKILDWLVPDILVSEINFQRESVDPLMQRLKYLAIANGIPIPILITSTCPQKNLGQYIKVGVEAYLLKPIDIDDFVFKIWSLVLPRKNLHPSSIQDLKLVQ